jgi:hypothetical protein
MKNQIKARLFGLMTFAALAFLVFPDYLKRW